MRSEWSAVQWLVGIALAFTLMGALDRGPAGFLAFVAALSYVAAIAWTTFIKGTRG